MSTTKPKFIYIMQAASDPGLCYGCKVYNELGIDASNDAACDTARCMPEENPERQHKTVVSYTRYTIDEAAEALQARSTGSATSMAAAGKVQKVTIRQAIIAALRAERTLTGKELATITGRPLNSVTPRFAKLVDDRIIHDTGMIRDGQTVWALT